MKKHFVLHKLRNQEDDLADCSIDIVGRIITQDEAFFSAALVHIDVITKISGIFTALLRTLFITREKVRGLAILGSDLDVGGVIEPSVLKPHFCVDVHN